MKKILFILGMLFFVNVPSQAQFFKNKALYLTEELELGNYIGGNININFINNNDYSLKLGFSVNKKLAKNAPENFKSINLFGPYEKVDTYKILVGKIFRFKKAGKTRFHLSAGVNYTDLLEFTNWRKETTDSNDAFKDGFVYRHDSYRHGTVGFVINPKIEFPFLKFFGLTITSNLNINKNRTLLGVGFGIMLGKTRNSY